MVCSKGRQKALAKGRPSDHYEPARSAPRNQHAAQRVRMDDQQRYRGSNDYSGRWPGAGSNHPRINPAGQALPDKEFCF